jgi:glutamate dehydrogenase
VSTTDPSAGVSAPADELFRRIADLVPPERLEAVVAFARAFTKRLPKEVATRPAPRLAAEIVGAFRLVDSRAGADVAVRVFNPDPEHDGFQAPGSVLQVNTEDAPFLFDSLNEELDARGLSTRAVIHPVVGTRRADDGTIAEILDARDAPVRESVMHFEIDRPLIETELVDLEDAVRRVLGDVRLAVRDFEAMREAAGRMVLVAEGASPGYAPEEIDEAVAFLRWLLEGNFVFLGYREYEHVALPEGPAVRVAEGSGLGIFSKPGWSAFEAAVPLDRMEPDLRARLESGDLLEYAKTNRSSTVHRRARMDSISVRRVSPQGHATGESRLVGLFTSKAYTEPASRTPVLRRKLARILDAEDLFEGSHDYKAVVSIFDGFPKAELLAAPIEELRGQVMALLELQEQRRVRLFMRRDRYGRDVALLVVLPRDAFSADLKDRLEELFLRRFKGSSVDEHLTLGEGQLAQIHLTVHVGFGEVPDVPFPELEREVLALTRTWDDRLEDRLIELLGEGRGAELADRWGPRFPETYKASTRIEVAAEDVQRFEELERGDEAFVVGLANESHDDRALTRVRLYKIGGKIQLSDFVPTLESLGLRVVEEVPTDLLHGVADERFLHDFGVVDADGRALDVERVGPRVADCIAAVWSGSC